VEVHFFDLKPVYNAWDLRTDFKFSEKRKALPSSDLSFSCPFSWYFYELPKRNKTIYFFLVFTPLFLEGSDVRVPSPKQVWTEV